MNKRIFILLIVILTFVSIVSDFSEQSTNKPTYTSQEITVEETDIIDPSELLVDNFEKRENIVYKTRTGKRYHASGCRYLYSSCIEIPLEKAQKKDLLPVTFVSLKIFN